MLAPAGTWLGDCLGRQPQGQTCPRRALSNTTPSSLLRLSKQGQGPGSSAKARHQCRAYWAEAGTAERGSQDAWSGPPLWVGERAGKEGVGPAGLGRPRSPCWQHPKPAPRASSLAQPQRGAESDVPGHGKRLASRCRPWLSACRFSTGEAQGLLVYASQESHPRAV